MDDNQLLLMTEYLQQTYIVATEKTSGSSQITLLGDTNVQNKQESESGCTVKDKSVPLMRNVSNTDENSSHT
jgi:hypothetical protein